jgi:hypothetical protein
MPPCVFKVFSKTSPLCVHGFLTSLVIKYLFDLVVFFVTSLLCNLKPLWFLFKLVFPPLFLCRCGRRLVCNFFDNQLQVIYMHKFFFQINFLPFLSFFFPPSLFMFDHCFSIGVGKARGSNFLLQFSLMRWVFIIYIFLKHLLCIFYCFSFVILIFN